MCDARTPRAWVSWTLEAGRLLRRAWAYVEHTSLCVRYARRDLKHDNITATQQRKPTSRTMCMNDNVAIAVANPREPQVTIVVVAREDAGAESRKPDAYHHRVFSFFDSSKRMRRLYSAISTGRSFSSQEGKLSNRLGSRKKSSRPRTRVRLTSAAATSCIHSHLDDRDIEPTPLPTAKEEMVHVSLGNRRASYSARALEITHGCR